MEDCINLLWDALMFSSLDVNSCSAQGEKEDADCNKKSAFTSHYGLYHFFMYAIQTLQCARDLPTNHGSQPVTSQKANRIGIFERHHHLFQNRRRTHQECLHRIVTSARTRCHVVLEEGQDLIQRKSSTWKMSYDLVEWSSLLIPRMQFETSIDLR